MIHFVTSLPLSTRHRVSQLLFHPSKPYLAVQSHDKSIDIFRVRTEEEIRKKQARRRKREREKAKKKEKERKAEEDMDMDVEEVSLADLFTPYLVVRASGKIRSFSFSLEENEAKGGTHVRLVTAKFIKIPLTSSKIMVALSTNSVEVYNIPAPTKDKDEPPEASRLYSFDLPGHRSDIRTLCLSSDDQLLASASNGKKK